MANLTTDGKICIERELKVDIKEYKDLVDEFDIEETCKWITKNNFSKVKKKLNILYVRVDRDFL